MVADDSWYFGGANVSSCVEPEKEFCVMRKLPQIGGGTPERSLQPPGQPPSLHHRFQHNSLNTFTIQPSSLSGKSGQSFDNSVLFKQSYYRYDVEYFSSSTSEPSLNARCFCVFNIIRAVYNGERKRHKKLSLRSQWGGHAGSYILGPFAQAPAGLENEVHQRGLRMRWASLRTIQNQR